MPFSGTFAMHFVSLSENSLVFLKKMESSNGYLALPFLKFPEGTEILIDEIIR
jgi:hypothetical protein